LILDTSPSFSLFHCLY